MVSSPSVGVVDGVADVIAVWVMATVGVDGVGLSGNSAAVY